MIYDLSFTQRYQSINSFNFQTVPRASFPKTLPTFLPFLTVSESKFSLCAPGLLLPLSALGPASLGLGLKITPSSLYLQPLDIFSFILTFDHVPPFTNMLPWPLLLLSAELSLPFLIRAFEASFYTHFLLFLIYSFICGAPSLCLELGDGWGTKVHIHSPKTEKETDHHNIMRFVFCWRRAQRTYRRQRHIQSDQSGRGVGASFPEEESPGSRGIGWA